jgi:hypothetical protein
MDFAQIDYHAGPTNRARADALRAELGVCGQRPSSTTQEEGLNDSFLRHTIRRVAAAAF